MGTTGYATFTHHLRLLAADVSRGAWRRIEQDVQLALNGQAAQQLRALVPLQVRREEGAFFTGGKVRDAFTSLVTDAGAEAATGFWDPSCGAGDLLLAVTQHLPTAQSLPVTLARWGRLLRGCDLQEQFVEAARLRLFLAAADRHHREGRPEKSMPGVGANAFTRVKVADGLAALEAARGFKGHLLLNPPYGSVQVDASHDWSSGAVSQAALFVLAGARALSVGQQLHAVLPDVLRSGTRYEAWRTRVEQYLNVGKISVYGQFDQYTDVDVFMLSGARTRKSSTASPKRLWWDEPDTERRLDDYFEVRVGPVVDNRDPHKGPEVPFLTARDLISIDSGDKLSRTRRYPGRLVNPPFVAVRRTSRPGPGTGGSARAAGVLITGSEPIAVDNHLIIIKPRSQARQDCIELQKFLSSDVVSQWLDQRIRCRHLTVGVVRALPWDVHSTTHENAAEPVSLPRQRSTESEPSLD